MGLYPVAMSDPNLLYGLESGALEKEMESSDIIFLRPFKFYGRHDRINTTNTR